MTLSPAVRPLLTPAILVGGYVILVTLTRDLPNIWPMDMGSANWRFGALGFLLGSGALPVVGLALILVAATLGERAGLAKAAGVVGFALGLVMLVGLVVFLVDSRALLAGAGGDAESMIRGATRRTGVLGLFSGAAYLVLGMAGWRVAAALPGALDDGRSERLVVGK